MIRPVTIAIDGPVGAGKSSISDAVAKALGILHLDTGAMYRAVGYTALKRGISPEDEAAVTRLCEALDIRVECREAGQATFVDGVDVTGLIRSPEVSMAASTVSKWPGVRRALVELQRVLASKEPMLLDGRDIGTRVLPDAPVKIFLTATPEERAKRRHMELAAKGAPDTYEQVLEELRRRDHQDTTRATDPLRPAEDAVTVDTTAMTFDEVVAAILRIVEEKQGE